MQILHRTVSLLAALAVSDVFGIFAIPTVALGMSGATYGTTYHYQNALARGAIQMIRGEMAVPLHGGPLFSSGRIVSAELGMGAGGSSFAGEDDDAPTPRSAAGPRLPHKAGS